ncbi:MAG: copper chaperone PCu(A)C [Verrucomicrobia bacterium]|nr:copper chaperone PCu(A)C [Verrucomicrobiota bacterium]
MKPPFALLILTFALSGLLATTGRAEDVPLQVTGGWVQAVPPGVSDSAAFFRITNPTDQLFELVSARTPIAGSVDPMVTTRDDKGRAGMEPVTGLRIPAHGELILQPGGDHLMLMSLHEHLQPGENVAMVLIINPGRREMQVSLPVLQHAPRKDAQH